MHCQQEKWFVSSSNSASSIGVRQLATSTPSSVLSASLPITAQESECTGIAISAAKKSLSQEEIERISKAFLRLLQAPLTTEQGVRNDAQ
jgi:hypothetical protein